MKLNKKKNKEFLRYLSVMETSLKSANCIYWFDKLRADIANGSLSCMAEVSNEA